MKSQQRMHAAVLHGLGETPRYEPYPAPLAGDGEAVVTVTAAVTNPGMAAWKALLWEGELAPGQTVLVLGATGTSGRIATQLATRRGPGSSPPAATSACSSSSWPGERMP